MVFGCPCHLKEFNEYSNTKDASIKLSDEKNINGSLPYLGALLSQCKKIFTKKKEVITEVYFNFNSFIADEFKPDFNFT